MTNVGMRVWSYFLFRPRNALYPFEQNALEIIFELNTPLSDEHTLTYDWSISGSNTDLKSLGWDFYYDQVTATVRDASSFSGTTQPQLVWSIPIKRPVAFGVKLLLPPCAILLLVLASFTLPLNSSGGNIITRLGAVQSALLSLVMYHVNTKAPFTGQLIIFDQFIIIIYIIVILSVAATIAILRLQFSSHATSNNLANVIQSYSSMFVWLIAPMIFLFLFVEWWIALICLPLPSILLIVWLIIYRRVIRPRLYLIAKPEKLRRDVDRDQSLAQIGDKEAGYEDPNLQKEVMQKEMSLVEMAGKHKSLPNQSATIHVDPEPDEAKKRPAPRPSQAHARTSSERPDVALAPSSSASDEQVNELPD